MKFSSHFLMPFILFSLSVTTHTKVWDYIPDVAVTVQNNSARDLTVIMDKNPSGKIEKRKSRTIRNIRLQESNVPNTLVNKIEFYDAQANEYITFYLFIKKIGTSDREVITWLTYKNNRIVDQKETITLSPTDKDHYTIKIIINPDISQSSVEVITSVS